tara:strand:+ start:198 stop:566 length:369 start_codon:yes stop_codon:yes gene_type:complete
MSGLSPRLPITYDSSEGFALIRSLRGMMRQNFKMLILTIPGERVMEPTFGVGITTYLFSNFHANTYMEIDSRIREQTAIFMPYIEIIDISFDAAGEEMNRLGISIKFAIPQIGAADLLEFTI